MVDEEFANIQDAYLRHALVEIAKAHVGSPR